MKGTFIGIKHISGNKKTDGTPFAFDVACITTAMSDRDADKDAKGLDVHTPTIPDRMAAILNEANIGKEVDIEFYYANNRENIAYCNLLK